MIQALDPGDRNEQRRHARVCARAWAAIPAEVQGDVMAAAEEQIRAAGFPEGALGRDVLLLTARNAYLSVDFRTELGEAARALAAEGEADGCPWTAAGFRSDPMPAWLAEWTLDGRQQRMALEAAAKRPKPPAPRASRSMASSDPLEDEPKGGGW